MTDNIGTEHDERGEQPRWWEPFFIGVLFAAMGFFAGRFLGVILSILYCGFFYDCLSDLVFYVLGVGTTILFGLLGYYLTKTNKI